MDNFDAMFEQYAKNAEDEAKRASSKGNGFQRNYEEILWTGLKVGVPSVFRMVGAPPDSNVDKSTARTCTISRVVGDDGKKFKLVRDESDPNNIINRIMATVNKPKWSNQKDANGKSLKTYPNRELLDNDARTKDVTRRIDKNGLTEADRSYIFERGWKGSKVLIANVIDRSRMDEHREKKHTFLLAKSVTESGDNTYVEEGVSAFGVITDLTTLFRAYGSWEKYDVAITRTGQKLKAYSVINASKSPEFLPADLQAIVSTERGLTDEENSWERYDLEKFYRPTSAIKIQNKLGKTIASIDSVLGTNFSRDLAKEVEVEKARLEQLQNEDNELDATDEAFNNTIGTPASSPATTAPTRKRVVETAAEVKEDAPVLPFLNTLSAELQSKILRAVPAPNSDSDKHWDIEWNLPADVDVAACPVCHSVAPLDGVDVCPVCGEQF